jgi:hypothetical protein
MVRRVLLSAAGKQRPTLRRKTSRERTVRNKKKAPKKQTPAVARPVYYGSLLKAPPSTYFRLIKIAKVGKSSVGQFLAATQFDRLGRDKGSRQQ